MNGPDETYYGETGLAKSCIVSALVPPQKWGGISSGRGGKIMGDCSDLIHRNDAIKLPEERRGSMFDAGE